MTRISFPAHSIEMTRPIALGRFKKKKKKKQGAILEYLCALLESNADCYSSPSPITHLGIQCVTSIHKLQLNWNRICLANRGTVYRNVPSVAIDYRHLGTCCIGGRPAPCGPSPRRVKDQAWLKLGERFRCPSR